MDLEYLIRISQLLQFISIMGASCVAIYGINAWRRELKGKREIELAEEVLSLFYEIRELVSYIRSPVGFLGEGETRIKNNGETVQETTRLNRAFVVYERYEKVKDKFVKLFSLKYKFMAIFAKTGKPFDDIFKIREEIFLASKLLGTHYWMRQEHLSAIKKDEYEKHLKSMEEKEAIFWEGMKDPDPVVIEINRIVSEIEIVCSKTLKVRYNKVS